MGSIFLHFLSEGRCPFPFGFWARHSAAAATICFSLSLFADRTTHFSCVALRASLPRHSIIFEAEFVYPSRDALPFAHMRLAKERKKTFSPRGGPAPSSPPRPIDAYQSSPSCCCFATVIFSPDGWSKTGLLSFSSSSFLRPILTRRPKKKRRSRGDGAVNVANQPSGRKCHEMDSTMSCLLFV